MRKAVVALASALLLASSAASQGPPPAPKPAAQSSPAVEFGDPGLPAAEKELLARSAQQVARWAMVQRVVQAVRSQQAAQLPAERLQSIDAAWQRGEDPDGLASRLGKNDCAQALQTMLGATPGYVDAYVADDRGALVCMSQRTRRYLLQGEPEWSRAFAGGTGAIFVSGRVREEGTGLDLAHIAVPIRAAGKVIGVLVVGRIIAPG
jgi:hypothetical protein